MEIKKGSLSYFILLGLEKTIDGYVRFEDYASNNYKYFYGVPDVKKSALSSAIRRLRVAGYIQKEVNTGKIIFKLTKLGKEAIPSEFDESKWDGKWRIVIFDIPEEKRIIRNLFRRNLKKWGFKKWQQSVWINKQDVTEKLKRLINTVGISDWVAIIESDDPVFDNISLNGRTP